MTSDGGKCLQKVSASASVFSKQLSFFHAVTQILILSSCSVQRTMFMTPSKSMEPRVRWSTQLAPRCHFHDCKHARFDFCLRLEQSCLFHVTPDRESFSLNPPLSPLPRDSSWLLSFPFLRFLHFVPEPHSHSHSPPPSSLSPSLVYCLPMQNWRLQIKM